ncbi:MAG TPA: hypothetical protein VJ742_09860 [Nitrososphaera sp.]|nr:hypothetical protein [Nitrososphaera sp.]
MELMSRTDSLDGEKIELCKESLTMLDKLRKSDLKAEKCQQK